MSEHPPTPAATVVIPTRNRPDYLEVTLASIAPQLAAASADVVVVCDGPDGDGQVEDASARVARSHGARVLALPEPEGANAARNLAVAATSAPVLVFVDDDIDAPPGWLGALLAGVAAYPDHEVFGGPIVPRLDGGGPRHCGREPATITSLELGPDDRDAEFVWSANLAVRRTALQRVGAFDTRITIRGDEEEWQRRFRASGGRIRYLAGAGVVHRRTAADAALRPLARAAYRQGRAARANDVAKVATPTLRSELRDLAGGGWHLVRRRCGYGAVFAAHAAGRIAETLAPQPPIAAEPFLSGESGYVAGLRAGGLARLADGASDLTRAPERRRLRRDAAAWGSPQRVLVCAVERDGVPNLLDAAADELRRSRHAVTVLRTTAGDAGKFENIGRLLDPVDLGAYDWLIVLDDDVALPRGFLDAFLFLADRHGLVLAQPAHRRRSHAGWRVTRRRRGSAVRETSFVEIGPVTALHRSTFDVLLPFPPLRAGWGLDAHWGALAAEHGWRIGVVDATAIGHSLRPVAANYDASAAIAEARAFLADRPFVDAGRAQRTLRVHRGW